MKKLFFSAVLLALSITANAQFTLTPTGFKSSEDATKDFIVVEAVGKSASDLYSSVLIFAGKTFVSPKDVVSEVKDRMITINAVLAGSVDRTKFHGGWDLNLTIVIEFKDGKVKINAPNINSITTTTESVGFQEMFVQKAGYLGLGGKEFSIFDKKGKLKIELAKSTTEQAVNNVINNIEQQLTSSDNDEW